MLTKHAVVAVVDAFIKNRQMFTVYDVYKILQSNGSHTVSYDQARTEVESLINDNVYYKGYTRTVGDHIPSSMLNKSLGQRGAAPQVYHHSKDNYRNYQIQPNKIACPPLNFTPALPQPSPVVLTKVATANNKGLFKFDVWVNGKLRPCNFVQVRGSKGKFVPNQPYHAAGVLDDGTSVEVRQDSDGKLYVV